MTPDPSVDPMATEFVGAEAQEIIVGLDPVSDQDPRVEIGDAQPQLSLLPSAEGEDSIPEDPDSRDVPPHSETRPDFDRPASEAHEEEPHRACLDFHLERVAELSPALAAFVDLAFDAEMRDALSLAARELLEETGYHARKMKLLGTTHPNPAILSNQLTTYLATDLDLVEPEREEFGVDGEHITVEPTPLTAMILVDSSTRAIRSSTRTSWP